jgi:dTDP-4-amino-4,6-dideoxygalactose transaminase
MIPVTKPFLPPQKEYNKYLQGIWKRNWLTNMGPLANELERKLKDHLNVQNLLFVANGTNALQMAIKALGLKGEVITTSFSFIAATSSIVWEDCNPVFVDIDKDSLNIDL